MKDNMEYIMTYTTDCGEEDEIELDATSEEEAQAEAEELANERPDISEFEVIGHNK